MKISDAPNKTLSAESHLLVSGDARRIFQWVFIGIICQAIDIFGTVTNIINIICFVKQGLKDPVNISLLGLAISDLGSLVTLMLTNVLFTPLFYEADVVFDAIDIQFLTGGWPHVTFTRITSWITALITLERCLCITLPLKVKNIITPKRTAFTITFLFILIAAGVAPMYYTSRMGWKYSVTRNKTILGLVFTDDRETIDQISYAINNVLIPVSAFVIIIICTVTLIVKLQKKTQWREKNAVQVNTDTMSSRDRKVATMVLMISTLFIACFIPACIIFMAMVAEPQLAVGGKYENTLFVVYGISINLESLNSSVNIFIYYHMSTKYRQVFKQLFSWPQKWQQ